MIARLSLIGQPFRTKMEPHIDLDKTVYRPGEEMKGAFSLHPTERTKVNGITVQFTGDTKVEWRTIGGRGRHRHAEFVHDQRQHIDSEMVVMKKSWLDAEPLSFGFKMPIPRNFPQSFSTGSGRCKYRVKGIVDVPWELNKTTEKVYEVWVGQQSEDYQLEPLTIESEKVFGFVFKEAPCLVRLAMPRTYFKTGEVVSLVLMIDNQSERVIDRCQLELMQHTLFSAKERNRRNRHAVWEQHLAVFCQPGKRREQEICFTMPVVPSTQTGLANISYVLLLKYGSSQGFGSNGKLHVPIVVSRE